MFLNLFGNNKKGFSIVEILAAIVVISIALVGLSGLASFSLRASSLAEQTAQANSIAQETIESLRNFRDGTYWNINGLGTLAMDVNYYPQETGSPLKWQLVQGTGTTGMFTRKIVLSNVQRDANDNIVGSGGTNDPQTKKVVATVSWQERGKSHKVEITTYLTAWKQ
ncbi:MAG: prepilin-type N-terminal cleavage/methylation domain-containing protein [bacterium]|nr:prepilin-type N-terminal cleavage/methylation domain-containing protein [bacterium]